MVRQNKQQSGVMMAAVVILFTACTLILTALLQMVTTTASFSNEIVYRQIAQAAAKSALEQAKEEFDASDRFDLLDRNNDGTVDNDTNLNGTPDTLEEKPFFENSGYRVTYQLTVKAGGTSTDGRSKVVVGTGRVYLPPSSTTARYTKAIAGEVIRTAIVSSNPSDYSPLAWYDASCGPPSTEVGCELPTVLKVGTANVAANPVSLREENKTTGSHCGGAPNTTSPSDNRLSMTKNGECGVSTEQRVGLLFNAGSGLSKGSTIETASLQFTAGGLDNVDVTLRIRGIKTANHPNFTTGNSSELSPTTNAYVDWIPGTWPNSAQSGNKQRTPNISTVLQEVIDQAGWNTSNNIGVTIECVSGDCNGTRRALMTPLTLNITYSGYSEAATGENVQVWRDKSGNGFHLTALDSTGRPLRSTVTQSPTPNWVQHNMSAVPAQNRPMVRFTAGSSAMSAQVPLSTGRTGNSFTTFAVINFRKTTDAVNGNGHIVSFRGTGTGDVTVTPYWRHPASGYHPYDAETGITADYVCQGVGPTALTSEYQCRYFNLINASPEPWSIVSNRSELYSVEALFRNHGLNSQPQVYTNTTIQLNAPYTIALGYNPRNNVRAAGFDVSELILYDRTLTCPQMEAVEQYLAQKWGYEDDRLGNSVEYESTGCRENNLPAY